MLGIYNSDGRPFSVRLSIVCLLFCVNINIPMHIHKRAFHIDCNGKYVLVKGKSHCLFVKKILL